MDETLNAILDLLRDEFGALPGALRPSARIRDDLCIDGDDAVNLVQRLHERFGTEFLALGAQWEEFFNSEGASPGSGRFGMIVLSSLFAGCVASIVAAVASEASSRRSVDMVLGLAAAATFCTAFLASRLFPARPKRPVTVLGLAEIVRSGAWPTNPALVR